MMFSAHLDNQLSDHVITDFAQTFERQTGIPMTLCREIVEDSGSIFNSFSYLIEYLFSLIDSAIPCQTFIIKGLSAPQRRDFYLELSNIGIHFTKNRYIDDIYNQCTDICISTANIWSVPDYRTNPELAIYQHRINVFNAFYSRIDNLPTTRTAANGNIIVSLENFLKFKRIFADAHSSYNNNRYINYNINNYYVINNNVYMPNQPAVATTASQPAVATTASQSAVATTASQPAVATTVSQSAVATTASQPAVATTAYQPAVATTVSQPAVATTDYQPAVATTVSQPAVATTAYQPAVTTTVSQPYVSSNTKIKHQLADLIFDIKDDLTDCVYKDILEKIALISP